MAATQLLVRTFRQEDMPAALALINADRLPAQPSCSATHLCHALAGRATIDGTWWNALAAIHTLVCCYGNEVVGVASYGLRRSDGAGFLLWLHARENREVIEVLLSSLSPAFSTCPRVYAFWFASPLTYGVEGLPVAHRMVTHHALLNAGFSGSDDWLYMAGPALQRAESVARVNRHGTGWRLTIQQGREVVGEARIGIGEEQIGALWWLEVRADRRGCGLGKQLFQQARAVLGGAGARLVVLYVDHDDPVQRPRSRAIALYRAHGFSEIDHLWSYVGERPNARSRTAIP